MKVIADLRALLCATLSVILAGCGSNPTPSCTTQFVTSVTPSIATADHMEKSPGDQQRFQATQAARATPGCAVPQIIALVTPNWTVSDPVNVQISNAKDDTNGTATCLGPTSAAVSIVATVPGVVPQTANALLTCK